MEGKLVLLATLALFIAVLVIFCLRGWFIRAGLAMLVIEILPMTWQIIRFPDSDAPGTAFLAMALTPFSVIVLGIGIAVLIFRAGRKLSHMRGDARS